MIGLLCFVLAVLSSPFKSKLRLEAENAVLRHQLIVLRHRLARFCEPASSILAPSWADFIATTPVVEFSVHTSDEQ